MKFPMPVRRWWLAWVLIALVGAQALGQLHRVGHAPEAARADAHPPALAAAHLAAHETFGGGWLHALFAGHEDYSGCLSFDAVGHDGLAPPATLPAAALPAPQAGAAHLRAGFAQCASAAFQARAPPASR